MSETVHTGRLYYEPSRIHAAAIYCSDGRMGEHFDEFLQNGLRLPRYDRLAWPGGPAMLLDHRACMADASGAWQALDFLVNVHGLERILLIAHEGCAFYSRWLGIPDDQMESRQQTDLARAVDRLREFAPQLHIDAYFARISGHRVVFEEAGMLAPRLTR